MLNRKGHGLQPCRNMNESLYGTTGSRALPTHIEQARICKE